MVAITKSYAVSVAVQKKGGDLLHFICNVLGMTRQVGLDLDNLGSTYAKFWASSSNHLLGPP